MADSPLITIGITAYNAQTTLAAAIDSARTQDWPNKEIVLIDDASSDETAAIAAAYPDVLYHRQPENRGVAAARNQVITMARGEFIAFFDDDDISQPNRLTRQYNRIHDYEAIFGRVPILCHSARIQQYPNGRKRYEGTIGMNEKIRAPQGEIVARRILTGKPFPGGRGSLATSSQMARTDLYKTLGGFDEYFRRSEDTDFSIRHALIGGAFLGIAAPLVTQTMTQGDDKTSEADYAGFVRLYDKHEAFLDYLHDDGFSKAWCEARFALMHGRKKEFISRLSTLARAHPLRTAKKIYWALPNAGFTAAYRGFQAANK